MKLATLFVPLFAVLSFQATAHSNCQTHRHTFFEHQDVKSWKTTLCESGHLEYHTHQTARVIIPKQDGTIKIHYQDGTSKIIPLKKDTPSYLPKSEGLKLHQDINLSGHDIELLVVEIK
ncbi:hypothetical protein JQC92_15365 [Shewanella sp. 202IG2-18]|uniref:hypothetical protein n=1 Tax=Parashewanella hymeniacidonis TaxID=2807618 RepID=UPI0019603479|nr:hypothetical protein [Parashewanella hymeniacidonis]MBM7073393.1 hypothetical protein [Parashewanella hymeniacidonis]